MSKPNTDLLKRPQCMGLGELRASIEEFRRHLTARGHTPLTVSGYGDGARHFAEWLHRAGIVAGAVDDGVILRFERHRCRCPGSRRHHHLSAKYVRRVRRFIGFLAERGVVKITPATASALSDRVAEFQDWLRHHRGISERTVDRHGRMVTRLLPDLGDDPAIYDVGLVRRVILAEALRSSRPYVKCDGLDLI
jgi:hypothetical protein